MHWPAVEPGTSQSRVRHANHYTTKPPQANGQTINSQIAVNLFAVCQRLNHLACYGRRRRSCAVKVKSPAASLDGTPGRCTIQRLLAFTTDVTLLQTVTDQIQVCVSK